MHLLALSVVSNAPAHLAISPISPQQSTSLDLRPAFGPTSGGTALFILHHRDFGAAHDVLVGKSRLNCSLVPRGEDSTTASRCCCTPPVANETILPLSIIHRSGHTVRPTHASFAFYREPQLLWISPQRVPVSAGSVPIVFAMVGWPSTEINGGRDHLARCRFAGADRGDKHKLVVVSAVIVARSDSWRFKRPSNENETWLQCKTPDLRSKASGHLVSGARGRGGDVLTAWISPNGVDFLHEGLPVDVHAVPSYFGDLPIGWLPMAFGTCFGVCVLMALLHSCATLKAAMADSGWVETTPTHWHASQWHDALRFRSSKLHATGPSGGRLAKYIQVSRSFDSLVPMFSDRLSRISESQSEDEVFAARESGRYDEESSGSERTGRGQAHHVEHRKEDLEEAPLSQARHDENPWADDKMTIRTPSPSPAECTA